MTMRRFTISAAIAALALAGCSATKDDAANTTDAPAEVASDDTESSQEPKQDCANLPRPDDKPDNDIIGIDMGMSADDVLKIARCSKEGYAVQINDDRTVTLPDGSHPRGGIEMKKEDDQGRLKDQVVAFLVGLPGQERVIGLVRQKGFSVGEQPTIEQVRASLIEKYGPVQKILSIGDQYAQAFAPDGKLLPENMVGGWDCSYHFGKDSNLGKVNESCGFTKKFWISPSTENPALSGGFFVWLGNQNQFFVEARHVVAAVRQMQQQAQEAERQKAESSDRVPDL